MQIINATKTVKNVMTSSGELITIQPGGVSQTIIATPTIIGAAIKLGSEKEIGLVLPTSYELEQARKVSASAPYIYTELDEAKSKLLDPSIEYIGSLNATKMNFGLEVELKKKDEEIKKLTDKIAELEVARTAPMNARIQELESKLASTEIKHKESLDELVKKSNMISELQTKIDDLNSSLNKVRADYGAATQNLTIAQKASEEATNQLDQLKSELGTLKSDLAHKTAKLEEATAGLKESTDTIENMKEVFNGVCKKFNIIKTEEGEFVMNPQE